MKETGQYQQGALDFRRPEAATPAPRDPNVSSLAPVSRSASSRLPGDLWHEYRHEIETRERLDLPFVGLDEFQDMRDWSDGVEPQDVAWPSVPTQPAYPSKSRQPNPD